MRFLPVLRMIALIGLLLTLTGCFSSARVLIPATVTPGVTLPPTLTLGFCRKKVIG